MVGASAFILGVFLSEAGMEHEAVDDFRHAFLQLFIFSFTALIAAMIAS